MGTEKKTPFGLYLPFVITCTYMRCCRRVCSPSSSVERRRQVDDISLPAVEMHAPSSSVQYVVRHTCRAYAPYSMRKSTTIRRR